MIYDREEKVKTLDLVLLNTLWTGANRQILQSLLHKIFE